MKTTNHALPQREEYKQDKQRRLKQFREATRAIGEAVAKSGLSEEEIMEQLEDTKREVFEKTYGRTEAADGCQFSLKY